MLTAIVKSNAKVATSMGHDSKAISAVYLLHDVTDSTRLSDHKTKYAAELAIRW